MATGQTKTDSPLHPVAWVLVGVLGTLAVGAAVSFRPQLVGRQPTPNADGGDTPKTDVTLPLPPVPPDPVQPLVFPVTQPKSQGQELTSVVPKPVDALKDVSERVFTTPEAVLKAYLAAKRWEDRLPCVVEPKTVQQLMAIRYKNTDLSSGEVGFLPATLTVKMGAENRLTVEVDVRESQPYQQYLRYAVVKSGAGYKVDWRESIKLSEEDSLREEVNKLGLTTPVLEIQILKKF